MYTFLIVVLIINSLVLTTAVLLQAGKGGGLAASFGGTSSSSTDSLLGSRAAGTILTKTSWWAGAIFMFLAYVLQIMSVRSQETRSILDRALVPGATAPSVAPAPEAGIQSAVPLEPIAPPQP